MTWGRLDDGFWRHRKYSGASLAATGLQARSLSYCNDQLNDGHLTLADLVRIAPEARPKERLKLAAELVARNIWEKEGLGWYIHDYPDYNKLRVAVEAERASAAERMANVRANKSRTRSARASPVREKFNDPVPRPTPKDQTPRRGHRAERVLTDEQAERRIVLKNALVTLCGWEPESMTKDTWGRVESAAKQLQDVRAEPDLMRGFAALWAQKYPGAPLTPQAFTNNWADYMAGKLWPELRARR